jgi:hypothetical protein
MTIESIPYPNYRLQCVELFWPSLRQSYIVVSITDFRVQEKFNYIHMVNTQPISPDDGDEISKHT